MCAATECRGSLATLLNTGSSKLLCGAFGLLTHRCDPAVQVKVKPTVRGLTEIGRDGSHVLVAMGFREVDNVVANAVFQGAGQA